MPKDAMAVSFQGEIIDCETGLDAAAIKRADDILSGRETADESEIGRLAAVLDRYNTPIAAQRLRSAVRRPR